MLATLWALGVALPASAGAARSAEALCEEFPKLNVPFRFGTGFPAAGPPAVAPDGSMYIGTREGYLHALHPDGSYHWSYTVSGRVSGRPAVASTGVVLVPTVRRIYALRPNGSLLWIFNSPVRIQGDLTADSGGRHHFGSVDGRVFALSNRGALVGHIPGKVRLSVSPVTLSDGSIAAGREDGSVVVKRRGKLSRFRLNGPVTAILGCPGAEVCAIAGGALHALGASGGGFQTPAVRAGHNAELISVVRADDHLEVFRGTTGERLFEASLPYSASAPPAVDGRGTTYVPLRNGSLLGVDRGGRVTACVPIGNSPLGAPILDVLRNRVLVTASEGVLAAVQLE